MDTNDLYSLEKILSKSERYSDLMICCDGYEFKVSRAVVCPQSPVIAAECEEGVEVRFLHGSGFSVL